jgi:hypothetical protein
LMIHTYDTQIKLWLVEIIAYLKQIFIVHLFNPYFVIHPKCLYIIGFKQCHETDL